MDRSTSVSTGSAAQSLTPGEQRILTLMEQGQQRVDQRLNALDQRLNVMDQRLDSLEQGQRRVNQSLDVMDQRLNSVEGKLGAQGQQLMELACKVNQEAAASRFRDQQLTAELQRLREEQQERDVRFRETLHNETNKLRVVFSEHVHQHNTRLELLEQTVEVNCVTLREHSKALQELRKREAESESKAHAEQKNLTEHRLER